MYILYNYTILIRIMQPLNCKFIVNILKQYFDQLFYKYELIINGSHHAKENIGKRFGMISADSGLKKWIETLNLPQQD